MVMATPSAPIPRPPPGPMTSTAWRRLVTLPLRVGPYEGTLEPTPFLRLAVLHACSSAGDALVTVALAGSVFVSVPLTAARGRTALGLVCTVLPFAIVGPLLGPHVDRMRGGRRLVIALTCVGRAAACLAMAQVISSLWLFPAAFASLVCSKTYLVAKAALVPGAVASDEDLVTANSRLAVGSSVVTSLAAALGVGTYRFFGSAPVLYADAALFVAGAVLAGRVRPARDERGAPVGSRGAGRRGAASSALGSSSAASTARVRPGMRPRPSAAVPAPAGRGSLPPGGLLAAALAMASMRAVAGLMTALVIFAFRRDHAPLVWYGLVGVASVAGNLGGAALAPAARVKVREERLVVGCCLAIGAAALAMVQVSVMHRRPAALVLGIAVGVGASVAKLAFDALVQREVPDERCSRRFAQYETGFQLAWVLAALGPVLVALSLAGGFLVVALFALAGAVIFEVGMARARRGTLPRWWPDRLPPPPTPSPPGSPAAPVSVAPPPAAPRPATAPGAGRRRGRRGARAR